MISVRGVEVPNFRAGKARLLAAVRAEGGLLADSVAPLGWPEILRDEPEPGQLAAAGPRTRGREADYQLIVDLIREGQMLHGKGRGWVVATDDPDLALLLGDQLYALGLSRLARLGDVDAVTELADVISFCARATLENDGPLYGAAWDAGAVAIGWGDSPELRLAKEAALREEPGAVERLSAAARELAQPR